MELLEKYLGESDLAKEIEDYAKKHGGVDKDDFLKAANLLKKGNKKEAIKLAKQLDTSPRDWLLGKLN
jgi:hypothetical protein